ncbi:MAG: hypothetical protein ACRCVJ_04680 [Clostridium sp.]|uniref:hypothetical protein n=1 Tax=Clostridium sp. TaxID=1506 RepID=UPI003F3D4EA1
MEDINIIYNIKGNNNIIYKLKEINEVNKELKIITNNNISNYYYKYRITVGVVNIELYDVSMVFENILESIIVDELKEKNNIIVFFNEEEDNKVNLCGVNVTKVKLSRSYIERIMNIDAKNLLNYVLKEYLKKLYIENDINNCSIYFSGKTDINKLGYGVLSVLSEYRNLSIQKEVIINIISGERLYLDTLAYITDPILEYTAINSKVTINNIVQEDLKNNFIINILGAF